jgi:hypothetical protein
MHYELVSRAVAYVSCFSTMSLLLTSMAIAAVHGGKLSAASCRSDACIAGIMVTKDGQFGALMNPTHVDTLATHLWPAKA